MGYTALALAVASTAYSVDQSEKARSNSNKAADKQREAQQEQKAAQAQQAAQERRQQIRDERVRRARIIQASENTGVDGSSGEAGATGSLATQLGSNIGFNLGQLASAGRRGDLLQSGADFMGESQGNRINAQYGTQVANWSGSIFSASGGFSGLQTRVAGTTTSTGNAQLGVYPSPQSGP